MAVGELHSRTLGKFLGYPDWAAASPDQPAAAQARVDRLRQRFVEYWTHPLWQRWRRQAGEDYLFVIGEQWDPDVRRKLEAQERTVLTINEIRPVVEVLTGYERSARLEAKPIPEGREDLENVTLLGRLMKREMDNQDGEWILSEGFKDGVVTGLGTWRVGINYDSDPIHGEVELRKIRLGEWLADPYSERYDWSDAREQFWHRMVPVDDVVAAWPDHETDIRRAVETYAVAAGKVREQIVEGVDPLDNYRRRDILDAISFYDETAHEVRIVEAWFREWETVHLLVDLREDRVEEIPDDPVTLEAARAWAQRDEDVRVIRRQRRVVKMSVILPALGIELEHGNPFENDTQDYPFVPFVCYRELDEILGIVRNLKDPQREVNKRRSAMADNIARFGAIRWFAHRGTLENESGLESGQGAGHVYWLRSREAPVPQQVTPPQMPPWVWQMQAVAKQEIKEISGVNADLMGQRDADASGIAIARRQQQGQIIATAIFDNYKRSRRQIARRFAKRVQQVYTAERTVRLDTGAADTDFVTLNQRQVDAESGAITTSNRIPDVKIDVMIADSPSTPTARMQATQTLMDLIQRAPALAPVLVDFVVELSDIPERERVLARIRTLMQRQGLIDADGNPVATPPAAAMPGAAGPPPIPGRTQRGQPNAYEPGALPIPKDGVTTARRQAGMRTP
jgi:hypothetical protein